MDAIPLEVELLTSDINQRSTKTRPYLTPSLALEKASSILKRGPLVPHESVVAFDQGDRMSDKPSPYADALRIVEQLDKARECAAAEDKGLDPFEGKSGYFECAYRSRI